MVGHHKAFFLTVSLALLILTGCSNKIFAEAPLIYQGETVERIYSLDYDNRSYQEVTEKKDQKRLLSLLDSSGEISTPEAVQCGFLIFTGQGKHTFYLPSASADETSQSLIELSAECNEKYERHPQWLAYMSEENIEEISFCGYHRGEGSTTEETPYLTATLKNRESIGKVSGCLKNMTVERAPDVRPKEQPAPKDAGEGLHYRLTLRFQGGIVYECSGAYLSITSSDMKERISYAGASEGLEALWDTMDSLEESERISEAAVWLETAGGPANGGFITHSIEPIHKTAELLMQMTPTNEKNLPFQTGSFVSVYLQGDRGLRHFSIASRIAVEKTGTGDRFYYPAKNVEPSFDDMLAGPKRYSTDSDSVLIVRGGDRFEYWMIQDAQTKGELQALAASIIAAGAPNSGGPAEGFSGTDCSIEIFSEQNGALGRVEIRVHEEEAFIFVPVERGRDFYRIDSPSLEKLKMLIHWQD